MESLEELTCLWTRRSLDNSLECRLCQPWLLRASLWLQLRLGWLLRLKCDGRLSCVRLGLLRGVSRLAGSCNWLQLWCRGHL